VGAYEAWCEGLATAFELEKDHSQNVEYPSESQIVEQKKIALSFLGTHRCRYLHWIFETKRRFGLCGSDICLRAA